MRVPDRAGRGERQGFRAAVSGRTMHDPAPEWVKTGMTALGGESGHSSNTTTSAKCRYRKLVVRTNDLAEVPSARRHIVTSFRRMKIESAYPAAINRPKEITLRVPEIL